MNRDQQAHLARFLENEAFIRWRLTLRAEENDYWDAFIREHPDQEEAFNKAIEICDRIAINKKVFAGTDLLYQRVLRSAMKRERQKKRFIYAISTVAAVALIFVVLTFFSDRGRDSGILTSDKIVGKTLPDSAIRLVAGEEKWVLEQNAEVRLTNGEISYTDSTNTVKSIDVRKVDMNKLIVPDGKRSFLCLDDGTRIWVNSGTTVEFPSRFSGKTREIRVAGEIFLDVAHSSKQPFVVHTAHLDVQVHGTRFNVTAYEADEGATSVVLVKGKVEVKTADKASIMMEPDERIEFREGNINKEKVDVAPYISWVDGVFIFDKTPVVELFKKVGRYYNVSFEGIESDEKITGKLHLPESLDDVLTSVSLLTGKKYRREGDIIKESQ